MKAAVTIDQENDGNSTGIIAANDAAPGGPDATGTPSPAIPAPQKTTVTGFAKAWIIFWIVGNLAATCAPANRLTDSSLGGIAAMVMLLSAAVMVGYLLLYFKNPIGLYLVLIANILGMFLNNISVPGYSINVTTGFVIGVITFFVTRKQVAYPFGSPPVMGRTTGAALGAPGEAQSLAQTSDPPAAEPQPSVPVDSAAVARLDSGPADGGGFAEPAGLPARPSTAEVAPPFPPDPARVEMSQPTSNVPPAGTTLSTAKRPTATSPARTSPLAIVSLAAGMATWLILPLIGAVAAIVTGHLAKKQIRRNPERLTGSDLATVGLAMGYTQLALALLVAIVAGFMLTAARFGSQAVAARGALPTSPDSLPLTAATEAAAPVTDVPVAAYPTRAPAATAAGPGDASGLELLYAGQQPVVAPSPTAAPTPFTDPASWPLVLRNTFDNFAAQSSETITQNEFGVITTTLSAGVYRLEAATPRGLHSFNGLSALTYSDAYAAVDLHTVTAPPGSAQGLALRKQGGDLYFAGIVDGQYFIFNLLVDDQWIRIVDLLPSPSIRVGEFNRLAVAAEGTHFTFWINDQFIASADDSRLSAGQVGLDFDLPQTLWGVFEFDNFELRALTSPAARSLSPTRLPAASPTPRPTTTILDTQAQKFFAPGPHAAAIAVAGDTLWVADGQQKRLHHLDRSGVPLGSFPVEAGGEFRGLAWDGEALRLLVNDSSQGVLLLRLDPAGTLLSQVTLPGDLRGLAWNPDANTFWTIGSASDGFLVEFGADGILRQTLRIPVFGGPEAITWAPDGLWVLSGFGKWLRVTFDGDYLAGGELPVPVFAQAPALAWDAQGYLWLSVAHTREIHQFSLRQAPVEMEMPPDLVAGSETPAAGQLTLPRPLVRAVPSQTDALIHVANGLTAPLSLALDSVSRDDVHESAVVAPGESWAGAIPRDGTFTLFLSANAAEPVAYSDKIFVLPGYDYTWTVGSSVAIISPTPASNATDTATSPDASATPTATVGQTPAPTPVAPTATVAPTRSPTRAPTRPPPTAAPRVTCPDARVRITYPANGATIAGVTNFIGTANVPDLAYYKFEYKPASSPTWNFLTQVDGRTVVNDKLMDFFTSTVAPGVYDFRLIVVDKSGNYPSPCELQVTVQR